MRVRASGVGPAGVGSPGARFETRRPQVVWRLRRSWLVRRVIRSVGTVCAVALGVVALITAGLVAVSGHAVGWSVVGFLFAALPLVGLVLVVGVGLRAAVAAGPGWVGVRILRHWRVLDLGAVRAVSLGRENPLGGFGPFGSFGGGRFGDAPPGGPGGVALVLEDASGSRVEIEAEALESGLGEVLRRGLAPSAQISPDAARALGAPSHGGDDVHDVGDVHDVRDIHDVGHDDHVDHDDRPAASGDDAENRPAQP